MESRREHSHHGRMVGTIAVLVLLALFATWFRGRDPLFASAWAHRSDVDQLFSQSWEAYLAGEGSSGPEKAAPVKELPGIQVLHYPNGDLINFQRGDRSFEEQSGSCTVIWADQEGRAALPGGGEFRLLAYALSVPQNDDPSLEDGEQWETLKFVEPGTERPVGDDELDGWGVSSEARIVSQSTRWFPMVRLLLSTDGDGKAEIGDWKVFDARSRSLVTQASHRVRGGADGPWVLDTDLSIWHETPLLFSLELACGQPEIRSIELRSGAQLSFQDEVCFQLLTLLEGQVESVRSGPDFKYLLSDREQPGTTLAYRILPGGHEHRFRLQVRQKEKSEILGLRGGVVGWALSRFDRDELDELKVEFLPQRVRVFLPLDRVVGMPNGEALRNLFDARIPRFTIPDIEANEETLAYVLLDVITGATMTEVNHWTSSLAMDVPEEYLPRQFIDTTPRELLEEYLSFSEDPYVRLDRDSLELVFHRPEPWKVRLERWWYLHRPRWRW